MPVLDWEMSGPEEGAIGLQVQPGGCSLPQDGSRVRHWTPDLSVVVKAVKGSGLPASRCNALRWEVVG